jgi:hypothetical protein
MTRRGVFGVQCLSALIALSLLVVTLVSPSWIEEVFGLDPDAGSGSFEWMVVGLTAVVAVAAGFAALSAVHRSRVRQGSWRRGLTALVR